MALCPYRLDAADPLADAQNRLVSYIVIIIVIIASESTYIIRQISTNVSVKMFFHLKPETRTFLPDLECHSTCRFLPYNTTLDIPETLSTSSSSPGTMSNIIFDICALIASAIMYGKLRKHITNGEVTLIIRGSRKTVGAQDHDTLDACAD